MEIVFYIPIKNETKLTKLTKSASTFADAFRFCFKFCKEFGFITPIAFSYEGKLYYYEDNEINSCLDNQMSLDELLENNWCDAIIRNKEDLLALDTEIDAGSLFLVRGDYAYYLSDYSIRIPLVDLEHVVIV